MNFDDEVCVCFHVSLRKLVYFARRENPRFPSQMSECLGAGTGCGWCIPILCKIAESTQRGEVVRLGMTPEEYVAARKRYRDEKRPRHQFSGGEAPAGDNPPGLTAGDQAPPAVDVSTPDAPAADPPPDAPPPSDNPA